MDKYYLFDLTDLGVTSAQINNIILSGMDLSKIKSMTYLDFVSITGIKKQEVYQALLQFDSLKKECYSIFTLTSLGISDKTCQNLKKLGITKLFMLSLYPEVLLKLKYNLTEGTIRKIKDALMIIEEPVDRSLKIVKEYLNTLYSDMEYMTLLKKTILKNLSDDYISEDELAIKLDDCYSNGSIMDKALEELAYEEFIEKSLFGIKKLQANLKEFLFSIAEDKLSMLLKSYLSGVSLDTLSLEYSIPKEKIKPTLQKFPFPVLTEDEYLDIYYSYYLNMDEFSRIFACDDSVYRYLELKAKKPMGKRNILEMLEDENVSNDVKVRIQNTLGKYAKIHGISVLKTPQDILDIYARFELKSPLVTKDCYQAYKKYWFSLFHEELPLTEKAFDGLVDQSKVLVESKDGIRYYNTQVIDSVFYKELYLDQYSDVELSTKIIFDGNMHIMLAYDIKDEIELYCILKKTYKKNNASFQRKPIIIFGAGNRNNQIKSILFELSPVSMSEFTKAYSKVFGVNEKSFSNYAAKQFSPYYQNATFTVNTPRLREEILRMYKSLLTDDFYFISDIGALAYKEGIPFQEYYINKELLKEIGYSNGIRCIYKDTYISLASYIDTLFKNEMYLKEMDPKLLRLAEFQAKLHDMLMAYEIFELEPAHFVSMKYLENLGITKSMIFDFIEVVKNSVYEDEVFTITSLKNKGFTHPILDFNLKDYFYSGLFYPSKDVIYQRCYMTNNILLKVRVSKEGIHISSLIEQIVESKYYMYLTDIVRDLEMIYGISLSEVQVKQSITFTDIYLNPDSMLYYLNYETYKRMR